MSHATPPQRWTHLRHPAFGRYVAVRVTAEFAVQIQTIAVGWALYNRTNDPLSLGLVGLSQFMPALALVLVTGAVADRFPRGRTIGLCLAAMAVCALALMLLFAQDGPAWPVFAVMAVYGTARAFYNPAHQALLASLVPGPDLAGALAANTAAIRLAQIVAPVVAGAVIDQLSLTAAFSLSILLLLVSSALAATVRAPRSRVEAEALAAGGLLDGFRYVWSHKVVLGAVSLDMVAVFLGGALTLMPVFARDILHVGPRELGFLYAAYAGGSLLAALALGIRPVRRRVGPLLFSTVAVFGLGTIVFGVSRQLELSLAALFLMGLSDMVSMNLRHTLVQIGTPDHLRGRVGAINAVSIGASNEMGQFRGGVVASLIGAASAVVIGGLATLVTVAVWYRLFPQLAAVRGFEPQD